MRLVECDKDAFDRICVFSLAASLVHNILRTLSRPKLYSWVKISEKYSFIHSSLTPLSSRFPGHEVNDLILVVLWFCHARYWFHAPISGSEVIAVVCHYCRLHWKQPTLAALSYFALLQHWHLECYEALGSPRFVMFDGLGCKPLSVADGLVSFSTAQSLVSGLVSFSTAQSV